MKIKYDNLYYYCDQSRYLTRFPTRSQRHNNSHRDNLDVTIREFFIQNLLLRPVMQIGKSAVVSVIGALMHDIIYPWLLH